MLRTNQVRCQSRFAEMVCFSFILSACFIAFTDSHDQALPLPSIEFNNVGFTFVVLLWTEYAPKHSIVAMSLGARFSKICPSLSLLEPKLPLSARLVQGRFFEADFCHFRQASLRKSTISRLLLRFYEPTQGYIKVAGQVWTKYNCSFVCSSSSRRIYEISHKTA